MRLTVFGANGGTGRVLVRQALDAGHTVVAEARRPAEFPFADPCLVIAGADVHDGQAVTKAVAGADAVLSTLGVGRFHAEPFNAAPGR